ncbi:MAG: oxidoreductase [Gammaproteobacteria bacterium]|nr:MAG: oxidoreductase [Gammaproteobacteria bacterium]PIE35730.1 MAG: oxidoreductase [Gammaproteobacteria bacterium]
MNSDHGDPILSLDEIRSLARDILVDKGFSEAQASAIAHNVACAERDGCESHGLFRIPFYVSALQNADVNPTAEPSVSVGDSSVIHVDAGHGFCPLALEKGLPPLIERTRARGIGALAIHRAYNIAALWPEVERLAEADLVAFAFTASIAYVAPAGGRTPVFGTNPMAFAFPRRNAPPLVFDQASSVAARGEILLHRRDGRELPDGWAIDASGRPTTDPDAALEGAQLPFGGYKGSSIALMVELLAGPLIGELSSREATAHDRAGTHAPFGGEFLMAIDPAHTALPGTEASHLDRAERIFASILEQEGTRLPSARRHASRKRHLAEGVRVSRTTLESIAAG